MSTFFYVTKDPHNLLSYESATIVENLKTVFRVKVENTSQVLTFKYHAKTDKHNRYYIFPCSQDLTFSINQYRQFETAIINLFNRSEQFQNLVTQHIIENVHIGGYVYNSNSSSADEQEIKHDLCLE